MSSNSVENTSSPLSLSSKRIIGLMYDAAIRGDLQGLNAVIDDATRFHEPPSLPYGGSYQGGGRLLELFLKVGEYLDYSTIKIHYTLAEGENVVTSLSIKTRTQRKEIQILEQAIIQNGKVAELRIYPFDPATIVADKT